MPVDMVRRQIEYSGNRHAQARAVCKLKTAQFNNIQIRIGSLKKRRQHTDPNIAQTVYGFFLRGDMT